MLLGFAASVFWIVKSPRPDLRVFSYSSFAKSWSAGPEIIKAFEKKCSCHVELNDVGDSALLMQKVKMELNPIDLVIGLDQENLSTDLVGRNWIEIKKSDITVTANSNIGDLFINYGFVAFDWSPLAFMVRKLKKPTPTSWDDLLQPIYTGSITIPDPRTSNIGWQFLRWIVVEKGLEDGFSFLQKFKSQILSSPSSWSSSYGLFQSGRADLSFTYLTSLLYHWESNKSNDEYEVAQFKSGHPRQVEYIGIPQKTQNKKLAIEFINFILESQQQTTLAKKNFMLPVFGEVNKNLPVLKELKAERFFTIIEKQQIINRWISLW